MLKIIAICIFFPALAFADSNWGTMIWGEDDWYIDSSTSTSIPISTTTTSASHGGTTTTSIGGVSTTTTTTIKGGGCPAKKVLGADSPHLENLRTFRDSSLMQSAVGCKIIQTYYNNAVSINAVLERSPTLQAFTRRILVIIASMVGVKEK